MMICDCYAAPATAIYAGLTAAGLKDSWLRGEPGQPGSTCCQIRDGWLKAVGEKIVGAYPACRSVPGGFWPSDHAGPIADLARGTELNELDAGRTGLIMALDPYQIRDLYRIACCSV